MSRKPRSISRFGIQRKIVANMTSERWRSIPHVSYIFEPDITDFVEKYKVFDDKLKQEGKHVTLNTVIIKAITEAIKAAPQLNAHIHFEQKLVRGKVITFDQIDISMPWILPDDKMMTITMKDMGNRSLGNITEYMAETAKKIEKTDLNEVMYQVSMHDTFEKLAKGIEIEKGKIAYCDCEIIERTKNETLLEVTLYQGLNRQIRKMIEHIGHNVVHLKRIRHATIDLVGLKKGQYKPIKPKQIKELKTYLDKIKEKEGI